MTTDTKDFLKELGLNILTSSVGGALLMLETFLLSTFL